jgi:diguanylate cyclase (GGDEF)-like protein
MKISVKKSMGQILYPLIFVSCVVITMWATLSYIETNSKQNMHKSLNTVLQITQEALELWVSSRLDDLIYFAKAPSLGDLSKTLLNEYDSGISSLDSEALQKIRALVSKKMRPRDDLDFFIIAPDRVSIASKQDANIGSENIINQQRKAYLDRVFLGETLFITNVVADIHLKSISAIMTNKQHRIFIATPILDETKNVMAALIIRLNPMTRFSRITQLGRVGETGETYAFDKKGRFITQSRFNDQLNAVEAIADDGSGILPIRVTDPGGNLLKGHIPKKARDDRPLTRMAASAISGDNQPYLETYRDYRGVPVFGAWLWNDRLGLGLTTEIDGKEALHPLEVTHVVVIMVMVMVVVILLTIGLVFIPLWAQASQAESLKQYSNNLEKTVLARTAELEEANKTLKSLCDIDPLTQIANRRLYEHTLAELIALSKRTSEAMSMMVIDIDFFKAYNDNYGHDKGDTTLTEVAQTISNSLIRSTDFVARYGGEEFVVLMPATDIQGAKILAKRIKKNIDARGIKHDYSKVAEIVTVSIGISSLTGEALDDKKLFRHADNALYQAKVKGRNQTIIFAS